MKPMGALGELPSLLKITMPILSIYSNKKHLSTGNEFTCGELLNLENIERPSNHSSGKTKMKSPTLPILASVFYWFGGLLTSLDVMQTAIFILQIAFLPLILIAAFFLENENLMMLGLVIMILGSLGPLALLGLSLTLLPITLGIIGGFIFAISDALCILCLFKLFKQ